MPAVNPLQPARPDRAAPSDRRIRAQAPARWFDLEGRGAAPRRNAPPGTGSAVTNLMRRFIHLTLLLLTALVAGLGLLRHWLGRQVTEQIAAGLASSYGGPVKLRDAEVGVNGTTLRGLEL